MQHLEVSCAVRRVFKSLGFKGLINRLREMNWTNLAQDMDTWHEHTKRPSGSIKCGNILTMWGIISLSKGPCTSLVVSHDAGVILPVVPQCTRSCRIHRVNTWHIHCMSLGVWIIHIMTDSEHTICLPTQRLNNNPNYNEVHKSLRHKIKAQFGFRTR